MKNLSKITILAAGLIVAISAFASENALPETVAIQFRATGSFMCYEYDHPYLQDIFYKEDCSWTIQEDGSNGLKKGYYNIFAKNTSGYSGTDNAKILVWGDSNTPTRLVDRDSVEAHAFTWLIQKPNLLGAPYSILEAPYHHVLLELLAPKETTQFSKIYTENFNTLVKTGHIKYSQIDIIKL